MIDMTSCYNGLAGDILQRNAEIQTNFIQTPLAWVPSTAFNWVSDNNK